MKSTLIFLLFVWPTALIFAQKTFPLHSQKVTSNYSEQPEIVLSKISDLKIAIVYTDSIINKYDFFKEKSKEITEKAGKFDLNLQVRAESFEQEVTIFQQTGGKLTQNQFQDKQDELMQKEQYLISYRNNLMQELTTDESNLLNEVYEHVQEYMKEYARENGIDLILSLIRGGAIWYATDTIDVTKSLVDGLNKKYKANPAASNRIQGKVDL